MSARRAVAAVAVAAATVLCVPPMLTPGINAADLIVMFGPITFVALLWPRHTPPAGDTVPPNAATTSPLVAHPAGLSPEETNR
ncbi:hypothetical protein [Microbacterium sp. 77mftsu3.1]|uniref:hypothetical protein n=1 Tax=Microbacterium sp. 77mftsu3.1 TaxID=1761802 RepID=UPI00037A64D5|nr:hypothetical protein [Microbacterium sp. 77mftsu3.1]SDG23251.1 hypothetical protein SAMN04488590_0264 [Microbacterium sp. 77mftsu3.1]